MSKHLLVLVTAAVIASTATARSETLLERGTYLMQSVVACGNCHTPQTPEGPAAGQELAGQMVIDFEPMTAYAPNITQDVETGIGGWTDDQIIRAIREGIRPDGTLIGPPMPIGRYRGMSDRDVKAIVAYLRTVKPIRAQSPRSVYRIPLPPSWGPPVGSVPEVPRHDKVRYGEYLAGALGHCTECHTPMAANGEFDLGNRLGAGGFEIPGPWGVAVSANITPHADGIGTYTDEQIKTAITRGVRPDGTLLSPPMAFAYYRNISAEDLDAIVAYLRALPPRT